MLNRYETLKNPYLLKLKEKKILCTRLSTPSSHPAGGVVTELWPDAAMGRRVTLLGLGPEALGAAVVRSPAGRRQHEAGAAHYTHLTQHGRNQHLYIWLLVSVQARPDHNTNRVAIQIR